MSALSDAQRLCLKKCVVKGLKAASYVAVGSLTTIFAANPHIQTDFHDKQSDTSVCETLITMYLYEALWSKTIPGPFKNFIHLVPNSTSGEPLIAKMPNNLKVFLNPRIFQGISSEDRLIQDAMIGAFAGGITAWNEAVRKVTVDGF